MLGAADRASLRLANRLAGNPEDAAALETSLQGPRLRAVDDTLVVLAGAPCVAQLDGHDVAMHLPIAIRAGQELAVGRASCGVRTYVAFAGRLGVAAVLGSRSTDTLGGLGPAPLTIVWSVPSARRVARSRRVARRRGRRGVFSGHPARAGSGRGNTLKKSRK